MGVRTFVLDVERLPNRIEVGRTAEDEATALKIDVNAWMKAWPAGTISINIMRPKSTMFYTVAGTLENGTLTYELTYVDTATAGTAKIEFVCTEGEKLAASAVMEMVIRKRMKGTTEIETPQPMQSWFTRALQAADSSEASAKKAEEKLEEMQGMTAEARTIPLESPATAEYDPKKNKMIFGIPAATRLAQMEDDIGIGQLKESVDQIAMRAYNRTQAMNVLEPSENNVYDVLGIPEYLTAEEARLRTGKLNAKSGWYWFGRIFAPIGKKISAEDFAFYGVDAILIIQPNDEMIVVAVRFDEQGTPVSCSVQWNGETVERFYFRCTDLAIRNLDYKTTYYVYDLAPYASDSDGKVRFEGMTNNVTYQYKERLSKPVEIVLPDVEDEDGHGVWMELQLFFTGAYSCTLIPPEGVVIKKAPTPTIAAGYNVLDLMYYNIDGVKCWRVQNTQSTI